VVRSYAEPNSWSHDDPDDPLSHHLEPEDPLADEWYDCFVLVSRRAMKVTIEQAIELNNRSIWAAIRKLFGKTHNLEDQMSEVDDALAEADAKTNELKAETDEIQADVLRLIAGASGLDKATAAKIRTRVQALTGVSDALAAVGKLSEPESTEPPADGEPVVKNDPQTVPVAGGDPLPVSNFPAEENPSDGSSGPVVDNSGQPE
jgi:hypothetical protein